MDVLIDGVRYVPATEAAVNMEAVVRGLVYQFWGETSPDKTIDELMDGLSVLVYDNGQGEPIQDVLADIARFVQA